MKRGYFAHHSGSCRNNNNPWQQQQQQSRNRGFMQFPSGYSVKASINCYRKSNVKSRSRNSKSKAKIIRDRLRLQTFIARKFEVSEMPFYSVDANELGNILPTNNLMREELTCLKSENDNLKEELAFLYNAYNNKVNIITSQHDEETIQDNMDVLRETTREQNKVIDELQKHNSDIQNLNKELKQHILEIENEKNEIKKTLDVVLVNNMDQKYTVSDYLESYEKHYDILEGMVKKEKDEKKQLEETIKDQAVQMLTMYNENSKLLELNSELKTEVRDMRQENTRLSNQLQILLNSQEARLNYRL